MRDVVEINICQDLVQAYGMSIATERFYVWNVYFVGFVGDFQNNITKVYISNDGNFWPQFLLF